MSSEKKPPSLPEKDFGTVIEPATFRIQRLLPGPIELVWAFLTESDKRGRWFCSGEMELREGGTFSMHFQHANISPEKDFPEKYKQFENGHESSATITECQPPSLLRFTWGEGDAASEVTIELTPRGEAVLLVLTQTRLAAGDEGVGTAAGWHAHLDILGDILAGRERRGFWSHHARLETEYETRLSADRA